MNLIMIANGLIVDLSQQDPYKIRIFCISKYVYIIAIKMHEHDNHKIPAKGTGVIATGGKSAP